MYLILSDEDRDRIRSERVLALEREHYRTVLQLEEMDALGVPADDRGRLAAVADLQTVAAALEWHRSEIAPPPRVEPEPETASGDDGSASEPLGEEASR